MRNIDIEAILKERAEKRKAWLQRCDYEALRELREHEANTGAQVDEFARRAIEMLKFYADLVTYRGLDLHADCGCGHPEGHAYASSLIAKCSPKIDDGQKARDFLCANGIEETTK